MAEEELHYPPGAEPEKSAEEPPAKDEAPEAKPDEGDKPEEGKDEPVDKTEDAKPEPTLLKKRTIYDDYKDKKAEVKTEKERADAAEAKIAELQGLQDAKDEATTPEEKTEAAKDIKQYAEKYKLDPDGLEELKSILLSDIPKPDSVLTAEEAKQWREERAQAARTAEDNQILAIAPSVKTQLNIQDDAEVATVMKEIVRLAHTPEFHDKEVEYIVWKNQEALSKLVSPKNASFEQGGHAPDAEAPAKLDYSSGRVTPIQAQKEMHHPKSSYEVRSSR